MAPRRALHGPDVTALGSEPTVTKAEQWEV